MGNWQLEVFKMFIYVTFPVTAFHVFNQPAFFENWVIETHRKIYPLEDKTKTEQIENLKREMQSRSSSQFEAMLESSDKM